MSESNGDKSSRSKPKFTLEEKAQIYSLFRQGLSHSEIAQRMGIDNAQRISGVVRAAINFDKIPGGKQYLPPKDGKPKFPEPQLEMPSVEPAIQMGASTPRPPVAPTEMAAPAAPQAPNVPGTQMAGAAPVLPPSGQVHQFMPRPNPRVMPAAPAAPQDQDGFSWGSDDRYAEGFNQTALATRYVIYRDEPADGLVGEESGPFNESVLGRKYGRGLYKIQRFKPGIPTPLTTTVRISESYGDPRFPRRETASPSGAQRPNYSRWGRPWARAQESQEEEGRPLERPTLYDYSRHAGSPDAAAEAIKAMGQMNLKTLELNDSARRTGPDAFLAKFLSEQQEVQRKQFDEQRRADDERRREEDARHDRRQKEADAEHRRRQEEEVARHQRDLERIRAESEARAREAEIASKRLMEIEQQKLKVVEQQNQAREEALKDELKRNREHMKEQQAELKLQLKDMQQMTSAQIQENQERIEKELQREREQLDREHKLKEKALEKERELENKVLDIKSTQIEAQGTNEIVGVVNNLINKFSASLNQVLELKKLEAAATPETQAAIVMKGREHAAAEAAQTPGAAQAAKPAPAAPASGQQESQPNRAAAQPPSNGNSQEINMKEMVRDLVGKSPFKDVIEEWALHVKTKQDGTTFLNMYREWMCDPNDHEGRKATTMFANFIAPREWEDFYDVIKDKLDKKVQDIFNTPHAKTFYETFRSLLVEQIRAFWEEFGQQRDAINAARVAAGTEVVK